MTPEQKIEFLAYNFECWWKVFGPLPVVVNPDLEDFRICAHPYPHLEINREEVELLEEALKEAYYREEMRVRSIKRAGIPIPMKHYEVEVDLAEALAEKRARIQIGPLKRLSRKELLAPWGSFGDD